MARDAPRSGARFRRPASRAERIRRSWLSCRATMPPAASRTLSSRPAASQARTSHLEVPRADDDPRSRRLTEPPRRRGGPGSGSRHAPGGRPRGRRERVCRSRRQRHEPRSRPSQDRCARWFCGARSFSLVRELSRSGGGTPYQWYERFTPVGSLDSSGRNGRPAGPAFRPGRRRVTIAAYPGVGEPS